MGNGMTRELDARSFDGTVGVADRRVIIDFWAPWCTHCKTVESVMEKIAADHAAKVTVAKVNYDENQDLATRYGVMGLPTVILFEGGKVSKQIVGARSQKDYEREFGLV